MVRIMANKIFSTAQDAKSFRKGHNALRPLRKPFASFALKTSLVSILFAFLFSTATVASAVDIDGAKPGVWTMDYDAAKKVAEEKKLPILLNFTGSDWCIWCEFLDMRVFSRPAWKKYALENLMLVWIDLPKNPKLVPDKYKKRNNELAIQHGVNKEGMIHLPAFFIYSHDSKTQLGRVTTPDRGVTAEKFIEGVKAIIKKGEEKEDAKVEDAKAEEG